MPFFPAERYWQRRRHQGGIASPRDVPATLGEAITANWNAVRVGETEISRESYMGPIATQALAAFQENAPDLAPDINRLQQTLPQEPGMEFPLARAMHILQQYDGRIREMQAAGQKVKTAAEVEAEYRAMVTDTRESREAVAARSSASVWLGGQVFGTMPAATLTPLNLVTLPMGAARSAGILRTALTEGLINLGTEAAIQAGVTEDLADLGIEREEGEALANVLAAGLGGFALGGAVKGLPIAYRRLRGKTIRPTRELDEAAAALDELGEFGDFNPYSDIALPDQVARRTPRLAARVLEDATEHVRMGRLADVPGAVESALQDVSRRRAALDAKRPLPRPRVREYFEKTTLPWLRENVDEVVDFFVDGDRVVIGAVKDGRSARIELDAADIQGTGEDVYRVLRSEVDRVAEELEIAPQPSFRSETRAFLRQQERESLTAAENTLRERQAIENRMAGDGTFGRPGGVPMKKREAEKFARNLGYQPDEFELVRKKRGYLIRPKSAEVARRVFNRKPAAPVGRVIDRTDAPEVRPVPKPETVEQFADGELEHVLRAEPDMALVTGVRPDGTPEVRKVSEMLDEIESERSAIEWLRGCLLPGGTNAG